MGQDIIIRKNTEKRVFKNFEGVDFIPPFISIALTEKGVMFEKEIGGGNVMIGVEYPRSSKAKIFYKLWKEKNNWNGTVPQDTVINWCGKLI